MTVPLAISFPLTKGSRGFSSTFLASKFDTSKLVFLEPSAEEESRSELNDEEEQEQEETPLMISEPKVPEMEAQVMDWPKQGNREASTVTVKTRRSNLVGTGSGDAFNEVRYMVLDYNKQEYAVLKIPTFTFKSSTASKLEFQEVVTYMVKDAKKRGIQKLIIDVTGNPGGYICAGTALAKYLLREWQDVTKVEDSFFVVVVVEFIKSHSSD